MISPEELPLPSSIDFPRDPREMMQERFNSGDFHRISVFVDMAAWRH